ncbi:hypothetical protein CLOM_g7795 [Closterium sp. NIES-68]|nr:hypothetical protein CLOM_g7795 [Closterium sp. NIES-68]GJP59882.1 hypothetical protein CLOP_g15675 [Closterium sp. NIES-67]
MRPRCDGIGGSTTTRRRVQRDQRLHGPEDAAASRRRIHTPTHAHENGNRSTKESALVAAKEMTQAARNGQETRYAADAYSPPLLVFPNTYRGDS